MNLYLWVSLMTYSLELLWINLGILNYSQPSKNRQRRQGLLVIHHGYLNLFSCTKLNESDMVSMLNEVLRLHCIWDHIILSATWMQINLMKNVKKKLTDVILKPIWVFCLGSCYDIFLVCNSLLYYIFMGSMSVAFGDWNFYRAS